MDFAVNNNFSSAQILSLQKNSRDKKVSDETDSDKKFSSEKDLVNHLKENYSVFKNGAASISPKYLRDCLNDDEKRERLFDNLQAASNEFDNLEKGRTLRMRIDSEGNVTMESSKTTVTFNEAKRASQLSAAKNIKDIQSLLNLLESDLKECEQGLRNNWCDEAEVKKVKKMIERAKQKMNDLKDDSADMKNFSVDMLI